MKVWGRDATVNKPGIAHASRAPARLDDCRHRAVDQPEPRAMARRATATRTASTRSARAPGIAAVGAELFSLTIHS